MASTNCIPYLGSRISLISRALIRYEGILININTTEQTVSLASVRCFGTEDRVLGADAVPPSNNVYEFIVFEGKRIKDITVSELAGLDDPAIVAINPSTASTAAIPGNSSSGNSGLTGDPSLLHHHHHHHLPNVGGQSGRMGGGLNTNDQATGAPSSYMMGSQQASIGQNMSQLDRFGPSGSGGPNSASTGPQGGAGGLNMYMSAAMNSGLQNQGGYYDYVSNRSMNVRKGGNQGQYGDNQHQNMSHYMNNNSVNNNNLGYNSGHNRRGGHYGGAGAHGGGHHYGMNRHSYRVIGELNPQPNSTLKMMVQAAFNFEEANSKFDKSSIAQNATNGVSNTTLTEGEKDNLKPQQQTGTETGAAPVSNVKSLYDKKASFFDNISCETLDRQSGSHVKMDPVKQRQLDLQTFGSTCRQPRLGRPGGRMGFRSGNGVGMNGYYRRNMYGGHVNNHMGINGYHQSMNNGVAAPVGFPTTAAQF